MICFKAYIFFLVKTGAAELYFVSERIARMIEKQNAKGQRRIRRSPKVIEAINNSRMTILVNMMIEFFSALVLLIGLVYSFKFIIIFRNRMEDTYFRIFLGAMLVFSAGWFSYIFIKIREHFRLLMKYKKDEKNS